MTEQEIDSALASVKAELLRANKKHGALLHSAHEGYAVLKEEVDELWDDVKQDNLVRASKEAIQVGAMAVKFIVCMDRVIISKQGGSK